MLRIDKGWRGDYRVIYRIAGERRTVMVMAIDHRSDAYRPHQP